MRDHIHLSGAYLERERQQRYNLHEGPVMKHMGNLVRAWNLRPGDLYRHPSLNDLRYLIGIAPLPKGGRMCEITFISQGHILNVNVNKGAIYVKING